MKLHPGCMLCKQKNIAKTDVIDQDTGTILVKKGDFAIQCEGIPADPVEHLISITDPRAIDALGGMREFKKMARTMDPVLWAEDHILVPNQVTKKREPWKPQGASEENIETYNLGEESRYYQEIMAKCTSRKICMRIGRRSGKTWTLILKILHKMFTNEKYRVLVITPAIAQLDVIFSTAKEFIQSSPTLNSPGIRFVQTPSRLLELPNGSFMRGFVSGNSTIRGQAADMIVIDEADYLETADLSAISAILAEHSDTILCVSSTPSGAREQFWKWDKNPAFRSFHFPSMCRPIWTKQMELEQRQELPGLKFVHEVLAEYGELSQGVFQHDHIDYALEEGDYSYEETGPLPGWIYTFGIDWNPKNGTECYVVGCDTSLLEPKYVPVDAGQVFREGNTQVESVNEIIRLNRKWAPTAIFADRGAGQTQIQYLEVFGNQAPKDTIDKRLAHIITEIDFGSKIEMRHPSTGQIENVYAKPALVENAVRMLESKQIVLSKYDQELIRQLRGYVIDKVGANKRPSYKMVSDDLSDHKLDALMLALFAFTMKFSKFGKPTIIPTVAFTKSFNIGTIASQQTERPKFRGIFKEEGLDDEREPGFYKPEEIISGNAIASSIMHNNQARNWIQEQVKNRESYTRSQRGGSGRNHIRRTNIR